MRKIKKMSTQIITVRVFRKKIRKSLKLSKNRNTIVRKMTKEIINPRNQTKMQLILIISSSLKTFPMNLNKKYRIMNLIRNRRLRAHKLISNINPSYKNNLIFSNNLIIPKYKSCPAVNRSVNKIMNKSCKQYHHLTKTINWFQNPMICRIKYPIITPTLPITLKYSHMIGHLLKLRAQ
jgi:hypothetical protein